MMKEDMVANAVKEPMSMQYVTTLNINLKEKEVYRYLGYGKRIKPSQEITHMLHEIILSVSNRFQALATYKILHEFQVKDKEVITLFGKIESKKISSLAKKSKGLLIGLVTAPEIVARTSKDNLTRDYIVYGIGIAVVEKAVDSLISYLQKKTKTFISLPFSPGYCDWDIVSGQKFIFKALDPSAVNVKLISKSLRMVPIHTISFVSLLGISDSDRNPCQYCTVKKCSVRRI